MKVTYHACTQNCKSASVQKQHGSSSKELKLELPYNRAIPLLGIYPKKMKILFQKDIYTPMLIAALFTIAMTWKQPNHPSRDEWIKKM